VKAKATHRTVDGHVIILDADSSRRMAGIRQKDTAPELAVRKMLVAEGANYRVRNKDLPGNPDVANRKRRWVIFVHGCYWHRHPGCKMATTPRRNADFWIAKFGANVRRDANAVAELELAGFRVLVVWECETRDETALRSRLRPFLAAGANQKAPSRRSSPARAPRRARSSTGSQSSANAKTSRRSSAPRMR
jgi:DNA mismatch endonuclease, patch repair protein